MNDYMYIGYVRIEAGKVVAVHNTQWLLSEPRFNPVHWVDDGEKVMAQKAINFAGPGEAAMPDGDYRLNAKGDVLYDFRDDIVTIDIQVGHIGIQTADPEVVSHYTNPQPQRPIFPEISFSKAPS